MASKNKGSDPMAIEVTLDARHELLWLRFDALRINDLRSLITNTFAVPSETEFTFKYKGDAHDL